MGKSHLADSKVFILSDSKVFTLADSRLFTLSDSFLDLFNLTDNVSICLHLADSLYGIYSTIQVGHHIFPNGILRVLGATAIKSGFHL